jgi:flagellar operon protein
MEIKNNVYSSIEQITGQYLIQKTKESKDAAVSQTISFEDMLRQEWQNNSKDTTTDGSLKFSKHAGERLRQRNITLSDDQMARLQDGAKKASDKGIRESLVIMDSLSFIVNTKSNTVITAMEQSSDADNIYTNIDGAVII